MGNKHYAVVEVFYWIKFVCFVCLFVLVVDAREIAIDMQEFRHPAAGGFDTIIGRTFN